MLPLLSGERSMSEVKLRPLTGIVAMSRAETDVAEPMLAAFFFILLATTCTSSMTTVDSLSWKSARSTSPWFSV